MKEKKENKALKLISNIFFTIFMIVMVFLIIMTAQSRFTGMEPSLFGNRLYIVDSGSMEPELPLNSLIVVNEKKTDSIDVGDVITYQVSSNTKITHRVIEIEDNDYFITQGDANNIEDAAPVQRENVIGVVTLAIPYLGYLFRFLSSTPGIVFLIGIGLVVFIIPMLFKTKPRQA